MSKRLSKLERLEKIHQMGIHRFMFLRGFLLFGVPLGLNSICMLIYHSDKYGFQHCFGLLLLGLPIEISVPLMGFLSTYIKGFRDFMEMALFSLGFSGLFGYFFNGTLSWFVYKHQYEKEKRKVVEARSGNWTDADTDSRIADAPVRVPNLLPPQQ